MDMHKKLEELRDGLRPAQTMYDGAFKDGFTAAIALDLHGKFAEWLGQKKWVYDHGIWVYFIEDEDGFYTMKTNKTTTELFTLFLETL